MQHCVLPFSTPSMSLANVSLIWFSFLPCEDRVWPALASPSKHFPAAATSPPRVAPATNQSQSPASLTAPRVCLRECARSLHARTRPLEYSRLSLLVSLSALVQSSASLAPLLPFSQASTCTKSKRDFVLAYH